jgi:hypothetical protein
VPDRRTRGPSAPPADFALPPGSLPPLFGASRIAGVPCLSARWTAESLGDLAAVLARGAADLRGVADETLLDAWSDTVEAFLDPDGPERQELAAALEVSSALSPSGLTAALEAVLGGVRRPAAGAMLLRAAALRDHASRTAAVSAVSAASAVGAAAAAGAEPPPAPPPTMPPVPPAPPVLVILASNLPALAVQPLLPCLALRRPVLLKSPSAEPLFAPAFVAALTRREPRLGAALAAVTWPGGHPALEAPVLAAAGTVLAYGSADAMADLERRAPGKVVAYGPKTSIAVVDLEGEEEEGSLAARDVAAALGRSIAPDLARGVAAGLARDIARFDQRGCLSVAAVYVRGGLAAALRLAACLETALGALAAVWLPGPAAAAALVQVQHARLETELRGLPRPRLPITAGTVLVEPEPAFRPSPGLRTVRVHPVPDLDRLPAILEPWRGKLQGAALAGSAAWRLAPRLADLGISRLTAPGDLQSPDAAWHNGGVDPLEALSRSVEL